MSSAAAEIVLPSATCVACGSTADIFVSYLRTTPFALALFRAAELAPLASQNLPRPLLDLACGAGDFSVCVTDSSIDVGLDWSRPRLKLAARRGRYESLACADAAEMPFADDSFASIVCISVLEHIADPVAVVSEAFRVLRPGGTFIASIVLSDIHRHLASAALFRRLKLPFIGRALEAAHDRVFSHICLRPADFWEELLLETGFTIEESRKTVSSAAMRWFELGLGTAWPYRLSLACGRPWSWRPGFITRRMARMFAPLLTSCDPKDGACLYIYARKPPRECVVHELSS